MAIDGDTLQIDDWHFALWGYEWHVPGCRVRLWGVDAPEVHLDEGADAADALAALLHGAELNCSETHGASYGRVVARCVLADGIDVAERLVRRGRAVDSPAYSGGHYAPAEAEARRHGRGMWGD